MPKRITVVDYGLGNLHSVHKALIQVAPDWQVTISDKSEAITRADKVVFPGVGAIGACIEGLKKRQIDQTLIEAAQTKPMLAICVGYQALFAENQEDTTIRGLGILPGRVVRFDNARGIKVPHMGWNRIEQKQPSPIWHKIDDRAWMYFVHSYYPQPGDEEQIAASCHYGTDFAACCIRDQLVGCQFHPEKSHRDGLQMLANFVERI